MLRPTTKIVTATVLFISLLFWLSRHSSGLSPFKGIIGHEADAAIPDYVHYVFLLEDPQADFPLKFYHFLSVYSAWHYLRPQRIFLHTNARDEQISRAQDGSAGKWAKHIFNMPNLEIHHVEMPTHAENGREIIHIAHKTDMIRVKAVRQWGGLYIDFDVFTLRDLKILRHSGFNAVTGREIRGEINSGAFLSKKHSKFISRWAEQMPKVYDGGWVTHSNVLMTNIGDNLVSEPGEMLIMERPAFAPGNWDDGHGTLVDLFSPRDEAPSNIENFRAGDSLPADPDDSPPWGWNFHRTYLLHAFDIEAQTDGAEPTPRYVLERRSNFARAVYPVAKVMYEKGLVTFDDLH